MDHIDPNDLVENAKKMAEEACLEIIKKPFPALTHIMIGFGLMMHAMIQTIGIAKMEGDPSLVEETEKFLKNELQTVINQAHKHFERKENRNE